MMKFIQKPFRQAPQEWLKGCLILLSILAYLSLFWYLYPQTGLAIAALSVIPVMLVGWTYGMRLGIVAGMLVVPLDSFNLYLMQAEAWADLSSRSYAGYLAVILAGAVVGRLHDLGLRLAQELQQRQAAEAALKQRQARLDVLHQIDQAILRAEKSEVIAALVLEALLQLTQADRASINLYDLQLESFTLFAMTAENDGLAIGAIQQIEDPISLQHMQNRQIYIVSDLRAKADLTPSDKRLLKAAIRSFARIPLISQNRLLGSINFHAKVVSAFSASDFEIAIEVADQLAIALENRRLLERERQHTAILALLQQASLDLSSKLNLVNVLDIILDYSVLLLMAQSVHLFLYHEGQLSFGAAFWAGKKQIKAGVEIQPTGIEYEIVRSAKICLIPDARHDLRLEKYGNQGSFLGLALTAGGETKGLICLSFEQVRHFEAYELHSIQLLADQAALAIQNAELYGKLQGYTEALERRVLERTTSLAQEKERLETILFNSSDAILLLDEQGLIHQANPAFYGQFQRQKTAQGISLASLFPTESQDCLESALQKLRGEQQAQRLELEAVRDNQQGFEVDLLLSPIIQQSNKPFEIVCSLRDISLRKQVEDKLRHALEQAQELSTLKSNFIAMVSHEFRTPLAVIQSSSEILLNYSEQVDEQHKKDRLAKILRQVKRLSQMMSDVLTLGRADQLGFHCEPQSLDLVALTQSILEEVQLSNPEKHVQLTYNQSCQVRWLDENLFRHILQNLVSNALKYSPQGSTIELRLHATASKTQVLVRDRGIGMPVAFQANLFRTFHRASNVGNIEGTGLGLAIVKRALEAQGGQIYCKSVEGQGTVFIVQLPNLAQSLHTPQLEDSPENLRV